METSPVAQLDRAVESYARLGVRVSPGFTISLFMEGLYLFYIILWSEGVQQQMIHIIP